MALTVNHVFQSTKATSSDPTVVSHDQWNSSHAVSGTLESSNITGVIASSQVGLGPFTANQVVYASSATTASGMTGTTWNDTNRALTITGSSAGITSNTPILNLGQTWNAVAVFTGFELSLTGLSFAGGSKLFNIDWQGTPTFYVGTDGYARVAGGLDVFGNTNSPGINLTATWNIGAATFFGLNMNITNTAAGANSRLVSLTVSASQVFAIDVNGAIVKGTLPSSQITGTLNSSQIVSIGSSQLTGTVLSSQIASVGSSQITGTIGSTQLASPFTVGFALTPYSTGTISAGTFTPNPINGNYQFYTNGGAHTIAASTVDSAIDILMYNSSSAGAVSFSGFTVSANTGDPITTTSSSQFLISLRRINSVSLYNITALQ